MNNNNNRKKHNSCCPPLHHAYLLTILLRWPSHSSKNVLGTNKQTINQSIQNHQFAKLGKQTQIQTCPQSSKIGLVNPFQQPQSFFKVVTGGTKKYSNKNKTTPFLNQPKPSQHFILLRSISEPRQEHVVVPASRYKIQVIRLKIQQTLRTSP